MWFGWNVKNFAQKLLIGPGLTRGSIDTQLGSCHFLGGEGGEGGEEGRGGEGVNSTLNLESCHLLRLGREGEGRDGDPGGGRSTLNLESDHFLDWGGRGPLGMGFWRGG